MAISTQRISTSYFDASFIVRRQSLREASESLSHELTRRYQAQDQGLDDSLTVDWIALEPKDEWPNWKAGLQHGMASVFDRVGVVN